MVSATTTIEIQASVGRLRNGAAETSSELATIIRPTSRFSPDARKGELAILLDPDCPPERYAALAKLLVPLLRQQFYAEQSFSATAGLRQAIRTANKALYEYNMGQPAEQRITAGLICVVIRDHDLYVAQVTPGQAFLRNQGRLRALPTPSHWAGIAQGAVPLGEKRALGSSLFVEPELFRATLRIGDSLFLYTRALVPVLSQHATADLLQAPSANALAEVLARAGAPDTDYVVMLCQAKPSVIEATAASLSPENLGGTGTRTVRSVGDWLTTMGREVALLGRGGRRSTATAPIAPAKEPKPDPLKELPEEPLFSANPPSKPRPLHLGESLAEVYERERAELPPSTFLGEEPYTPSGRSSQRIDLGDGPVTTAKPYRPRFELRPLIDMSLGERLMLPFRKIGASLDEAARQRHLRRRAGPRQQPSMRGLSYRRQPPKIPWLWLTVLSLTVTLLIVYGLNLSQQNADQRALDYLVVAEQRMAEVNEANTELEALDRLDTAWRAIEEVRASPTVTVTNAALWLRYQDLEQEYERSLASVQRLSFFDQVDLLATHPVLTGRFVSISVPPATSSVTDPLLIDNLRYLYALDGDRERAQLFRIPREGGVPESYLIPGEQVQSTIVGALRAQTWRTDQVVAVDEGMAGFGYYFRLGESWGYTKLGDSEIWRSSDRLIIEAYGGNLYVWGGVPNELLRYNSGFYGDSPQFWIDPTGVESRDLTTVVDMAIDGNVYLLQSSGRVLILSAGRLLGEIEPQGLTPAISAVTAMFVTGTPEDGSIFLLEPVNERIIQIDKRTGEVVQQIKVRPSSALQLDLLSDIWVDTQSTVRPTVYLVNGSQIVRAELPDAPRPFVSDGESARQP